MSRSRSFSPSLNRSTSSTRIKDRSAIMGRFSTLSESASMEKVSVEKRW